MLAWTLAHAHARNMCKHMYTHTHASTLKHTNDTCTSMCTTRTATCTFYGTHAQTTRTCIFRCVVVHCRASSMWLTQCWCHRSLEGLASQVLVQRVPNFIGKFGLWGDNVTTCLQWWMGNSLCWAVNVVKASTVGTQQVRGCVCMSPCRIYSLHNYLTQWLIDIPNSCAPAAAHQGRPSLKRLMRKNRYRSITQY